MKKPILETVHDAAEDMHDIGLMDEQTMEEFDDVCSTEDDISTVDLEDAIMRSLERIQVLLLIKNRGAMLEIDRAVEGIDDMASAIKTVRMEDLRDMVLDIRNTPDLDVCDYLEERARTFDTLILMGEMNAYRKVLEDELE